MREREGEREEPAAMNAEREAEREATMLESGGVGGRGGRGRERGREEEGVDDR